MSTADPRLLAYAGPIPGARRSDDWHTPPDLCAAIHTALGGVILDPFSSADANRVVRAARYLDPDSDALTTPWDHTGPVRTVFMNPPYSRGMCAAAVDRFLAEHDRLGFDAVVLVNNATEARWFQALLRRCRLMLLLDHRVQFWNGDGKAISSNTRGQALFYFGTQPHQFVAALGDRGAVMEQWGWAAPYSAV